MKRFFLMSLMTLFTVAAWAQNRVFVGQHDVLFKVNDAKLTEKSIETLKLVMQQIQSMPNAELTLKGSTDLDGSDAFNQALSTRRVDAVRQFLTEQGIAPTRIVSTQAIGETEAQNATSVNEKAQKRSVQIQIWRIETPPPSITTAPKPETKTEQKPTRPAARIFETETERQTERDRLFGHAFKPLTAPSQKFQVNIAEETVIEGTNGTIITLPADAFAGVPAGATVEFTLKENYSFSSMIADNLTTMSGNQVLQTGGMIFTEATYKGKPVSLKKPMKIEFSSDESRLPDMQIFTGKRDANRRGTIDWHATNEFAKDSLKISHGFGDFAFNDVNSVFFYEKVYAKDKKKRPKPNVWRKKEFFLPEFSPSDNYDPITYEQSMDTTGCAQLLYEYYELKTAPAPRNRCGQAILRYLKFTDPDRMENLTVKSAHRNTFKQMYKLYNVKKFQELEKVDGAQWTAFCQKRADEIRFAKKEMENYNAAQKNAFEARQQTRLALNKQPMTEADSLMQAQVNIERSLRDQSMKAFSTLNLGYINCDRFRDVPPEKVLAVEAKLDKVDNDLVQSYLILPRYRGVLSGNRISNSTIRFDGIPQGVAGKVVHVKFENNKYFVAVKSLRVKKDMKPVVAEFREMSLDNLESELNAL